MVIYVVNIYISEYNLNNIYNAIRGLLVLKSFLISIFLSVLCITNVHAYTLDEVLAHTYEHNDSLNSVREEVKAADEEIMQALSGWLPSLQYQRAKQYSDITSFPPNRENPGVGPNEVTSGTVSTLRLNQNLFRGGGDAARIKIAKYAIEQARARLIDAEQRVLLSAVDIYMRTLQSIEYYTAIQEQEAHTKNYLEGIRKRFEAGQNTRTNIAQAEASAAEISADRMRASSELKINHDSFSQITGLQAVDLSFPKKTIALPQNVDEATKIALAKNPTLISAINNYKAADTKINANAASLLPSVDFSHEIRDNSKARELSSASTTTKTSHTSTISLTVPLFNGGADWSKLRQAQRVAKQQRYALDGERAKTKNTAIDAWENFYSSESILNARNEQYKASKVAYEGILAEEKAGLRDTIDVINVRNEYFRSYKGFLDAKTNYYVRLYKLKSELGECTAQGLGLNVKIYDPMKNYNKIRWQLISAYSED